MPRQIESRLNYPAEYDAWNNAEQRCNNPAVLGYANVGGKGIKMCSEWKGNFAAFLRDMGEKPFPRCQLRRIDKSRDYEPGNCVWFKLADPKPVRHHPRHTIQGKTETVAAWAREYNIPAATVHSRLGIGWTIEEALGIAKRRRPYVRKANKGDAR